MTIRFTLAAPPSANRIWRVSNGKVHKSAEYRTWLKDQAWVALQQIGPQRASKPLSGPISVTVRVTPRDKRLRDLDNYAKPVMDFLEHIMLIDNDRQVERILMERRPVGDAHTLDVTVIAL